MNDAWISKTVFSPHTVLEFLEENSQQRGGRLQVKLFGAVEPYVCGFHVLVNHSPLPDPLLPATAKWNHKAYPSTHNGRLELLGFLQKQDPVDAHIAATFDQDDQQDAEPTITLHLFWRTGTFTEAKHPWSSVEPWQLFEFESLDEVLKLLRGELPHEIYGPVSFPIVCCLPDMHTRSTEVSYLVYCRTAPKHQPMGGWSLSIKSNHFQCMKELNYSDDGLPSPLLDGRVVFSLPNGNLTLLSPRHLQLLPRQIFSPYFQEYVYWQWTRSTQTTMVSIEHVLSSGEYVSGPEPSGSYSAAYTIRQCMRHLYFSRNCEYAMLVGDCQDGELDTIETAQLWHIPIGFVEYNKSTGGKERNFGTHFYAILEDGNKSYGSATDGFDGGYLNEPFGIYVGLMPVRSPEELNTTIGKTIGCPLGKGVNFTDALSESETELQERTEQFSAFSELLAGLFPSKDVCSQFRGAVQLQVVADKLELAASTCRDGHVSSVKAHGLPSSILIEGRHIGWTDLCDQHSEPVPAFLSASCHVQAFWISPPENRFAEGLVLSPTGPVAFMGIGGFFAEAGDSEPESPVNTAKTWFYVDLLNGRTLGAVFTRNLNGSLAENSYVFLGDPTLVSFSPYDLQGYFETQQSPKST